ncbi:hypothetical protein EDC45_1768 [Mesocricetibacter intestinalis]|uniref:Uncharacterized protein n=1 Tax=Mesocricetibacter intestinalis TaxID=1521930 RepID=A0A4R6VGD3_9PAST|nr:hypothetical protein [Mesocricetibacter intestinalis]TDQ56809.1 hypothetical protein EDC45_1768 [Mesocricetibacter intestinalis]
MSIRRRKLHLKKTNSALHLTQSRRTRRLKHAKRHKANIASRHAQNFLIQQDELY